MSIDRIEALRALLVQDPKNSFVRYGLAQAYAGDGRLEDAVLVYRELLERDPSYVAAYFHLGQTLEKLSRLDEAREVYLRGLDACTQKGDFHTRSEIQAALDLLPA
ncbi:MAG: tetratricopeptide repeat protein [Bryobacteraceae bacterium]|nr:tetratricopeptide repeat protein [Bryobacteraceae bacterium]MDW8379523.1 tetratricopeptide repeat protein [Bryobacterales bacterium]